MTDSKVIIELIGEEDTKIIVDTVKKLDALFESTRIEFLDLEVSKVYF